jgi:hypothetical protein
MTGSEPNVQPSGADRGLSPPDADAEADGDDDQVAPQVDAEWPPPEPVGTYVPPAKDRRVLLRPASALLSFGASVLTLLGSFMALLTGEFMVGGEVGLSVTVTSWEMQSVDTGGPLTAPTGAPVPMTGAPLMFAAAVLLAAALLGLFAAALPGSAGVVRLSGVVSAVAAALLLGTVGTIGMEELYWKKSFESAGGSDPGFTVSFGTGSGFWLLVGAVVLAVGAVAVSWLAERATRPVLTREEPDTPRFGVPVVVRLPDEPAKPSE